MIFVGDYIPQNKTVELPSEFEGELVLANLEGPVCGEGLPKSNKVGVCLRSNPKTILPNVAGNPGKSGGSDGMRLAFCLANNHMMDFRDEGLRQTMDFLALHGIPFAGAGENEENARRPMVLEEGGKRIAVFCCCERQFGVADLSSPGVAAKGYWLFDAIRRAKAGRFPCDNNGGLPAEKVDFVVVSCHAAAEFSPWVSPDLHDFYHALVEAGADVIHGHHSHVPQGYEEVAVETPDGGSRRALILYGLGNFVIDPVWWGKWEHYYWSLVAEVNFGDDGISYSIHPCFICREQSSSIAVSRSLVEGSVCDHKVDEYVRACNYQFTSRQTLLGCWQEVSVRQCYNLHQQVLRMPALSSRKVKIKDRARKAYFWLFDIMAVFLGVERPTAKSLFYGKVFFSRFNCESHYECIRDALGVLTEVQTDFRNEDTAKYADDIVMQDLV